MVAMVMVMAMVFCLGAATQRWQNGAAERRRRDVIQHRQRAS